MLSSMRAGGGADVCGGGGCRAGILGSRPFFFCLSGTGRDDPWLVGMDRGGHKVHIQAKYRKTLREWLVCEAKSRLSCVSMRKSRGKGKWVRRKRNEQTNARRTAGGVVIWIWGKDVLRKVAEWHSRGGHRQKKRPTQATAAASSAVRCGVEGWNLQGGRRGVPCKILQLRLRPEGRDCRWRTERCR
jgi:hypothetical protein